MRILAINDLLDTGHRILHANAESPLMQRCCPLWHLPPQNQALTLRFAEPQRIPWHQCYIE